MSIFPYRVNLPETEWYLDLLHRTQSFQRIFRTKLWKIIQMIYIYIINPLPDTLIHIISVKYFLYIIIYIYIYVWWMTLSWKYLRIPRVCGGVVTYLCGECSPTTSYVYGNICHMAQPKSQIISRTKILNTPILCYHSLITYTRYVIYKING